MKLGDVLIETGDAPLKGHSWTEGVLMTLNRAVPASKLLTEDSTGYEALKLLARLPTEDRARLLMANVDLVSGMVTYDSGVVSSTKDNEEEETLLNGLAPSARTNIALLVGIVILLVSLLMAALMTWVGMVSSPDHASFIWDNAFLTSDWLHTKLC